MPTQRHSTTGAKRRQQEETYGYIDLPINALGFLERTARHFKKELGLFQREFPNIEVRIYPNQHELHDRYALAKDAALILGHGVKDLGTKESFVLLLKGDMATDIRKILIEKFETRWIVSTPL